MPDPRAAQFAEQFLQTEGLEERETLKKRFAEAAKLQLSPLSATTLVMETSDLVGEDITQYLDKTPTFTPLNADESRHALGEATEKSSWLRTGIAKAVGGIEWYNSTIVEPIAATVMSNAFALTPGKQGFETRLEEAQRRIELERAAEGKAFTMADHFRAARETYRNTDTPWGLKGSMELVLDPLNLIGIGLPAKLSKAVPILKPFLFPLRAIDEAPAAAIRGAVKAPGEVFFRLTGQRISELPVVRGLKQPHWTSQVTEAWGETYSAVARTFVSHGFDDTLDPSVTKSVLGDLTRFPEDADNFSLRNVINHLEASKGEKGANAMWDTVRELKPTDAARFLADEVAMVERKALTQGGERLSGEVVETTISQRRQSSIQSVLERVRLDEEHAKGIASSIDKHVFGFVDNVYLKKIEPNLVRPWSLAHLAFSGFMFMNVAEDVIVSMLGFNNFRKFRVSDDTWTRFTASIPEGATLPPTDLIRAGRNGREILDMQMGAYTRPRNTPLNKIFNVTGGWFINKSSRMGVVVRRATYMNSYHRNFNKALEATGVAPIRVKQFMDAVRGEFPTGLEHIREDLGSQLLSMASTGNSTAVRQVADDYTPASMLNRAQQSVLSEHPELVPEARRAFRQFADREGGINLSNSEELAEQMKGQILERHKFTPEGLRAEWEPRLQAMGTRAPSTPEDAANQLRMLQQMADELSQLPREISKHTAERARRLRNPKSVEDTWTEFRRTIAEDVGEFRNMYTQALERSKPQLLTALAADDIARTPVQKEAVRRSIDEIFDSYSAIQSNINETVDVLRSKTADHLASVPHGDRTDGFWIEHRQLISDIWDSQFEFQASQANLSRTGWNNLLDVLPRNLNKKNRELLVAGLESTLGEAQSKLNILRDQYDEVTARIDSAPDAQQAELLQKQQRLVDNISVGSAQYTRLKHDLEGAIGRRNPRLPQQLREYDKALKVNDAQLKLAREADDFTRVNQLEAEAGRIATEREEAFETLIPEFMRPQWTRLQQAREAAESAVTTAVTPRTQQQAGVALRRIERDMKKFRTSVERGEAFKQLQQVTTLTNDNFIKAGQDIADELGIVPQTVEDVSLSVTRLAEQGNEAAMAVQDVIFRLEDENPAAVREVVERLYSHTVQAAERPALSPTQLQRLRDVSVGDVFPDQATVNLVNDGFLTNPQRLRNGQVKYEVTERGREALTATESRQVTVDELMADVPESRQEFLTILEQEFKAVDESVSKALDLVDNPPMGVDDQSRIRGYANKIADIMDGDPEFVAQLRTAQSQALKDTNTQYSQLFINYDDRSTFDFIMQRLMPFWMYESRRWPRLAQLAAQKPVLAKHYTMLMGEWDYGYAPTPWGMEMNPMKGTIVAGLRRTVARDFPELHGGFRGGVEEGLDWLGRGGFYFAPPITAGFAMLQGEPGAIAPPPVQLMLHGWAATGQELPPILHDFAFNSRYADFITDQVIADKYGRNAQEVRRLIGEDEPEAIAVMHEAQREAALRMIALTQTSILRYRPPSKREFIKDSQAAVEEYLGVTVEDQKAFRQLGVSPYEVIPVSRWQRQQIREAVPNYDAWINASVALRPLEEQKMIRKIDKFWSQSAELQEQFESEVSTLSDQWSQGLIDGPAARREYQKLQGQRSFTMDFLRNRPEFKDVPVTYEDRVDYANRFGKPPQQLHPADELLETYYQIKPDDYLSEITGEVDWSEFFGAREELLNSAPDNVSNTLRTLIQRSNTPLERMLQVSAPKLREYYGLREDAYKSWEQLDPNVAVAYRTFNQLMNQSRQTIDPATKKDLEGQARAILRGVPAIARAEAFIRTTRRQMRQQDPELELAYQLFIARPSAPSTGGGRRRGIQQIQPLLP